MCTLKEKVGDSCWESKVPLNAACLSWNLAGPSAGTFRLGALRRSLLGLSAGATHPLLKGAWKGSNLWELSWCPPPKFRFLGSFKEKVRRQPLGELSWCPPPFRFLGTLKEKVGDSRWESEVPPQLEPPDLDP